MGKQPKGRLIIIGGHEEKEATGDTEILREVVAAAAARGGNVTVITVATQLPREVAREYRATFRNLGVREVVLLDIRSRDEAKDEENVRKLDEAGVVFFTGGDQLRITSQIGDSPIFQRMHDFYWEGGTIAGTSAGAAAMAETMLIGGESDTTHVADLSMAPGLGLLPGAVIDTHFAERGRIGRLLAAVAQNPRNLGLGIDEDTAVVVERGTRFRVIGSGGIYVADGSTVDWSSLAEEHMQDVLSIHNVTLHVLAGGTEFDLVARRPLHTADMV